jgi:hypothetical protein
MTRCKPDKAGFLNTPEITVFSIVRKGKFRRAVKLKQGLHFYSEVLGREVVVPAEFVSDGASVPQIFWNIFPPFGLYLESAIVHDWFCVEGKAGRLDIKSSVAHRVFREAMKAQGVAVWKRCAMWAAVRTFGPRWRAAK